ncbi:MAG: iron-containing alcohol dehydrogenase [Rhizobiales bacterium]|nr:iron-containing alcohol dehydrogenase [Hyphomicrobiales bacterium]
MTFWHFDKIDDLKGDWLFPTETRFGAGRIKELPSILASLNMSRPLIVTDRGLTATPLPELVRSTAAQTGTPLLWAEADQNPTGSQVVAGTKAFHDHHADGVIALGGGSGLDCGKAVALLAGLGGDLWRFAYPRSLEVQAERSPVPIVAIPTTAGTGAEVEASSIITNEEIPVKAGIVNLSMMPKVVIADPELTVGLPANLTAWTGMDALSHNLEALVVRQFHPMADAIGAVGVKMCHDWLPVAVANGRDLTARSYMMAAAIMGATSFVKGLGAMHALSHAIGALVGSQHGLTNAVLMPYVLEFNRPAIEQPVASLAAYMKLEPSFDAYLAHVKALSRTVGIPTRITDLGVKRQDFERLAAMALPDFNAGTNPRKLDVPSLVSILQAAS